MPTKVLGQQGAIEQVRKYSGGPLKTDLTVRTWRGPKKDVLAKILEMKRLGYEWDIQEEGPNAVLTAQVPNLEGAPPEVPVETWELLPGETEKDFLYSDLPLCENILDDSDHPDKQLIRDGIENHNQSFPAFKGTGVNLSAAQAAYTLMLQGVKSTKMFAPVLKHTYVVSNAYAVKFANTNAKRVLTTPTLITTENVPTSFLLTLNSSPYTDVSVRTGKTFGGVYSTALVYGWFKSPPTLQTTANNRLQIAQQWEFGLWAIIQYGTPL